VIPLKLFGVVDDSLVGAVIASLSKKCGVGSFLVTENEGTGVDCLSDGVGLVVAAV